VKNAKIFLTKPLGEEALHSCLLQQDPIYLSIYLANQCNESGRKYYMVVRNYKICQTMLAGEEALQSCLLQLEPIFISPYLSIYSSDQCNEGGRKHYVVVKKGAILWQSRADKTGTSLFRCWIVSLSSIFLNCRSASSKLAPSTPGGAKQCKTQDQNSFLLP